MSETSSLTELARFIGRARLNADDPAVRRRAAAQAAAAAKPRPHRSGVADLLGVVLVLSARTRRMALPKVEIEIDVFAPDGGRALRIFMPRG